MRQHTDSTQGMTSTTTTTAFAIEGEKEKISIHWGNKKNFHTTSKRNQLAIAIYLYI